MADQAKILAYQQCRAVMIDPRMVYNTDPCGHLLEGMSEYEKCMAKVDPNVQYFMPPCQNLSDNPPGVLFGMSWTTILLGVGVLGILVYLKKRR